MDTVEPKTLYDRDFYAWTAEQAARLRRAAVDHVNADLDWENLAEEIESMGRSNRRELESRLTTILEHLLKLAFSTLWEPQQQWRITVRTQRRSLLRLLNDSPSLRRHLPEDFPDCYRAAAERVEPSRIELTMDHLPDDCPFDLDEQVLNEEWFPEPPFR